MSINGSEVSRHHVDRLHLANLYNYLLTLVIEIPFVIVWMTVTVLASTDYPLGKPLPMSIQVVLWDCHLW